MIYRKKVQDTAEIVGLSIGSMLKIVYEYLNEKFGWVLHLLTLD